MEWLNFHHLRYFWVVAREGSVSRAAKVLRVTQPTVSEQLHALEDALGEKLLRREGRTLAVTEMGLSVMRYADEIFSLGGELLDTVKGRPTGRPLRLAVGVADVVPKIVAYRILAPALAMADRVRIECCEDSPSRLLAALATHALDLVIADAPAPPGPVEPAAADALALARQGPPSRVYSHLLGECGVSVFGTPRLAAEMRVGFPRSLDGAPFLLPTANTALRRELDAWFQARDIAPNVAGEFQDAALLGVFAEQGVGLFAAPDAIAPPAGRTSHLRRVGSLEPLRARYYAITVERRIVHPAVAAIAGAARARIFGAPRKRSSSAKG
jgi:LysR family transcriptional regulator, transcriptional activator of nhaA